MNYLNNEEDMDFFVELVNKWQKEKNRYQDKSTMSDSTEEISEPTKEITESEHAKKTAMQTAMNIMHRAREKSVSKVKSLIPVINAKLKEMKPDLIKLLKKLAALTLVIIVFVGANRLICRDYYDFQNGCDVLKEEAYKNLLDTGLATIGPDGEFIIDNTIEDYEILDLAHANKYERYAYFLVLKSREFSDAVKGLGYYNLDKFLVDNGYYTTDTMPGLDLYHGKYPSTFKWEDDVREQIIDAYRDGTIYEIVRDLSEVNEQGRSH